MWYTINVMQLNIIYNSFVYLNETTVPFIAFEIILGWFKLSN